MTRIHEEDVLWLEVSVGEADTMQEVDSVAELVANESDLLQGVWTVVVVFL